MKRAFTTYAVALQVVAILLLQWYSIAPHVSRKHAQIQCSGDHRPCGCSPEKIVAHSCCCNQYKPLCHEEDHLAKREGNPSAPYFSIAPCGGSPKFVTISPDKLKFMPSDILPVLPSACLSRFPSTILETPPSRIGDPPEPPPKLLLFS